MRRLINDRDTTCRFPTCRQPASRTDCDHTVAYDTGGRPAPATSHSSAASITAQNNATAGPCNTSSRASCSGSPRQAAGTSSAPHRDPIYIGAAVSKRLLRWPLPRGGCRVRTASLYKSHVPSPGLPDASWQMLIDRAHSQPSRRSSSTRARAVLQAARLRLRCLRLPAFCGPVEEGEQRQDRPEHGDRGPAAGVEGERAELGAERAADEEDGDEGAVETARAVASSW